MATYPLEALLGIYRRRENDAERELLRAKEAVLEATRTLNQRRQQWQEYHDWWPTAEKEDYEAVMGQAVKQTRIESIKAKGQGYRDEDLKREQAIQEAEAALEKAKEHLEQCRIRYREAVIRVRKLETHREDWSAEQFHAEMEALEKEAEELYRAGRDQE